MIAPYQLIFVVCLLCLWNDSDAAVPTVSFSVLPIALPKATNDLNTPRLKNVIASEQEKIWKPLLLSYLELKVSPRNLTRSLWQTKARRITLNSCLEFPTSSCVIREAYIAANNITNAWRRDFSLVFLVGAQTEFGDVNSALKTVERIESISLRLPAFLAIAKEHAALKNFQEAKKITNEVVKNISMVRIPYIRTWVLALSASVFAEIGDLKNAKLNILHALQSMTKIKEPSTRAEMYALIASAKADLEDFNGSTENIANAFAEIDKTKDPFLSALALTFVAHAQAKIGQDENYRRTIFKVITKASTLRMEPRALVLSFASSTQAEVGDIRASQKTIESAIAAAKMLRDDHSLAPALAFIGKALAHIHQRMNQQSY